MLMPHGLRRTNADKRRAVELLLRDEEWSLKSDRWVAQQCAVGHAFVSKMRPQLSTVDSSTTPTPRLGQDGKTRKMPERAPAPEAALVGATDRMSGPMAKMEARAAELTAAPDPKR